MPQPFKFVGQYGVMTEPNGFYYMRARYYDPKVGRFISEDPIGFKGGDVNLYVYVGNNPINLIDPLGLKILWGDYAISSSQVTDNLKRLNTEINYMGYNDNSFELRVTGGDRFIDGFGRIRSLTTMGMESRSATNSPHLVERGARALDLQVTGISNQVFDDALTNGTAFSLRDTLRNYVDGHTHVNLPNQRQFYWDSSSGGCSR